ncbi:VOC family protein [Rhodococcus sp. T7]|jgi:hypothetical protein|uniref:VOC family protein n=1 Tax=Rhodococcus sp. T7 TaxID=627444 RepID=UPI001359759B|nr:VOC family protein [Rhodococcus sp. T7]KAF0962434.1 hypothetical protein MLGJGCBP_04403 [Rhodococcus sp. T7]
MTSRIIAIAVDCRDAEALARFWCEALGYPSTRRWSDAYGREYVEAGAPGSTTLVFQPVDDRKTGKNRLHLDIAPSSGTRDEEVQRLLALGARRLGDDPKVPWVVLADPEDNEFCVLPERGSGDGTTA